LPPTLQIEHGGSNQRWFLPLNWHNGAAVSDWSVPAGAKRGDYSLRLLDQEISPDGASEQLEYLEGIDTGAFSVGDFRVPLMRAEITPSSRDWVGAREAEFDLGVRYFNGGGSEDTCRSNCARSWSHASRSNSPTTRTTTSHCATTQPETRKANRSSLAWRHPQTGCQWRRTLSNHYPAGADHAAQPASGNGIRRPERRNPDRQPHQCPGGRPTSSSA
jgi:hypothetical protein